MYSVYVTDKFSDLGLVGVIGIKGNLLDLFALSCRALGRRIEDSMLAFVKSKAVTDFNFVSTFKNDELYEILKNQFTQATKE